jgi:hypothetical protein
VWRKRGQSAIEFVVLAGIMFLFFSISIIYVEDLMVQVTQASKEEQLVAVRNAILDELAVASRMPAGYSRIFSLPTDVQGLPYTITIQPDSAPKRDAMELRVGDTNIIVFLDYDVTGSLSPGWNTVRRTSAIVLN